MKKMPKSTQVLSESDLCTSRNGALTMRFSHERMYATVAGIRFLHDEQPSVVIRGVKRKVEDIC